MASSDGENLREFIITWRIENFSYSWHKKCEAIECPEFRADIFQSTEWCLRIYPRGLRRTDYISCYLKRNGKGPLEIKVNVEISFLGLEGSTLTQKSSKNVSFLTDSSKGFNSFVKQYEVFAEKRAEFLPKDILTVRCRLWRNETNIVKLEQSFVRTRLEVVRKLVSGAVDEFCSTPTDTVTSLRITSAQEEKNKFKINLQLTDRKNGDKNLVLQIIFPENQLKKISTCKVYLLDAEENKLECGKSDVDFKEEQDFKFLLFPTKWKLMARKSLYLPNDILNLECEIIIATGVLFEDIKITADELSSALNPISNIDKFGDSVTPSSALIDFGNLYHEQFRCDIILRAGTKEFPAHTVILSARSSVFRAMFDSDMKEKNNACVEITDFDEQTVCHLLLYVYTDTTGDLAWDTAVHLYEAADKYAIMSLKKKCSTFLKEFLCTSKACKLLRLADMYEDIDLKKFIKNYISQNYDKIFGSNEWKDLEQNNPQLIIETLKQMFTNVKAF